ncbi:MAG: hypothetical protein JSS29_00795 [Proteobacteria bacterium]|nr:hypothetical protein [Pseudomonadota bacterium]
MKTVNTGAGREPAGVRARGFAPRAALLAALCVAGCAACGHGSPSSASGGSAGRHAMVNMLCFTSPDSRKVVVSAVFAVRPYPPERMVEQPWAQDFRRYIGQSGNEGGISVTCLEAGASDAAKVKAAQLRSQGHEVVETQWSYAGG